MKKLGTFDIDDLAYLKKDAKPLTCISLFSGCGGMDIGTSRAGFETRVMVEWDKAACKTLITNWTMEGHRKYIDKRIEENINDKELVASLKRWRNRKPGDWYHKKEPAILCEDITKLSSEKILEVSNLRIGEASLLTGGFPCQGFSMANSKRDANDHKYDQRNFLYLECVRIVKDTLPKTFMFENVKGLVSMEKGQVIRMICEDLASVGYTVSWQLLDAADYGVPQHRERVFIMGTRVDVLHVKNKRPALHIGGAKGDIIHPDWFLKKYK